MKICYRKLIGLALALLLFAAGTLSFAVIAEESAKPKEPNIYFYDRNAYAGREYTDVITAYGMTLEIDPNHVAIRLTDPNGNVWESTPAGYEEDEVANGESKMAMASLLQASYVNKTGNLTNINLYTESIKDGMYGYEKFEDGVRFDFYLQRISTYVPVTLTLTSKGLEASVITSEIYEGDENFKLISISLLPFFGASTKEDEGYLLLPDGGGALVEYDSAKPGAVEYARPVYGEEPVTTKLTQPEEYQTVHLPVFGAKKNDQGYLAVLTEGASRGIIHARAGGGLSERFQSYPEFLYRNYDLVLMEKKGQTVRVADPEHTDAEQYTVSYRFLSKEKANYMGMAEAYRSHLQEMGMKKQEKTSGDLFLSLVGGAKTTVNVMGFPARQVQKFTGFADAVSMAETLKEQGVDGLSLQYLYWQKGGDDTPILNKISPDSVLGGKKEFAALIDYCAKEGVALYPEVDPISIRRNSITYFGQSVGVKNVQKGAAKQYTYRLNDGGANTTLPYYLLNHKKVQMVTESIRSSADSFENLKGIGGSVFGQLVYSDLGNKNIHRDEAEGLWAKALETLKGEGELLLSAPGAYALPYATALCDIPTESSGFEIETASVPFYALVVRGMMPVAGTNLNETSDPEGLLATCLSLGITPKFQTLAQNEGQVRKTALGEVYNGDFASWEEEMLTAADLSAGVMEATKDAVIVSYERSDDGLIRSEFENGVVVYVNNSSEAKTIDGQEIAPGGLLIIES